MYLQNLPKFNIYFMHILLCHLINAITDSWLGQKCKADIFIFGPHQKYFIGQWSRLQLVFSVTGMCSTREQNRTTTSFYSYPFLISVSFSNAKSFSRFLSVFTFPLFYFILFSTFKLVHSQPIMLALQKANYIGSIGRWSKYCSLSVLISSQLITFLII